MSRVRFSRLALADLEDISSYIGRENPRAAARVINRIEELCRQLATMPGLGRPSEVPGARKLIVPRWPYKIIYEINAAADEVVILRVYHGARDMPF